MMDDDIVIGEGDRTCSAITVFDLKPCDKHHISHNKNCYWITARFLRIRLTIFKNTPEGIGLTTMIEAEADLDTVEMWLTTLILRVIDPELILRRIKEIKEESFELGRASKTNQIKQALNIF